MSVYHGEDAQEDFLVLSGRCVLVVEGQERRLERHGTSCIARPGPSTRSWEREGALCVVLATGSRGADGIRFPFDATAQRHGASSEVETDSPTRRVLALQAG